MFSYTQEKTSQTCGRLREEFIKELNKKIKEESFKYSQQKLREKLRKEF